MRRWLPFCLLLAACQAGTPQPGVVVVGSTVASPRAVVSQAPASTPTPAASRAPVVVASTGAWVPVAVPTAAAGATPGPVVAPSPVASALGFTPVAPAAVPTPGPVAVAGTLIVTLTPGTDESAVLAKAAGFTRKDGFGHVLLLASPAGMSFEEAAGRVRAIAGVARVAANTIRRGTAFAFHQQDTLYAQQWAHRPDRANTEAAWGLVPAASQGKVIAAVLDSGLDVDHPEFAGRVQGARNFTADPPDAVVKDLEGHGTHVTGILGAAGDNGAGVAGVAWGVQLLPVKVLGDDGSGSDFDILRGFDYALHYVPNPDTGARVRVINMSLGAGNSDVSALWSDAVADAAASGVVVVAAAGNDGRGAVSSPANTPGVVAVGSTGNYLAWEQLSAFSNFGARLDVTAPGEGILSTAPTLGSTIGKDYATISGTSMASPYVAGVAALLFARYDANNQNLTAAFGQKVRQRLLRAVDDLGLPGADNLYGAGRLNAGRAVAPATIDDAP